MTLEERLKGKRDEILRLAAKYGARNVRAFGSLARGEADEASDLDAVFPLQTLRRLVNDGAVGELSTRHFSFMGAIHDPTPLVEKTGPEVAGKLVEDQVDVVLLTPS